MARRGIRINIVGIEEFNGSFSKFCKNETQKLKGRPTKVILRLLKYGIDKRWFEPKKIYKALIWFGFDSNYISDVFLAKVTFEYLFQDRSFKKEENLKKVEENEDA